MKYVDSHAHYYSRQFNKDRIELLKRLFETDVKAIVECGTNIWSNAKVIKEAENNENIYAVIGFFPTDVQELEQKGTLENLVNQLQYPKVLGLGEIGLDYYHKGDVALQRKWFIEQLKLAKKLNVPICIHSRDAEQDTLNILKNNGKMNGVIHCYAYGVKTMRELVKLGYYFGVGGTFTYTANKDLREAIKEMPLDRIVLETDSPFLSPQVVRRSRNDSSNIKYVIEELSKIKKVSKEEIIKITNKNVCAVYPKLKI